MENRFTERDSIPYIKRFLQSLAHVTFLVVSIPFLTLLIRYMTGQHDNPVLVAMVGFSTVALWLLLAVFYIFFLDRLVEHLGQSKNWYMRFLRHERMVNSSLLEYYNNQGKIRSMYRNSCKRLLASKGDRDQQREFLLRTHRQYLSQLQTAVTRLPKSEQKAAERKRELETDRFLDKLLDLEDKPIDPENAEYILEKNAALAGAEKDIAELRELYTETKKRIAELDRLINESERVQEVHV